MRSTATSRHANKTNRSACLFSSSQFKSRLGANGAQSKKAAAAARMKMTMTSPACNRGASSFKLHYSQAPSVARCRQTFVAMDGLAGGHDYTHKDKIMRAEFRPNPNVEIGRFKGLGEMMPARLK